MTDHNNTAANETVTETKVVEPGFCGRIIDKLAANKVLTGLAVAGTAAGAAGGYYVYKNKGAAINVEAPDVNVVADGIEIVQAFCSMPFSKFISALVG
jgi:hypothetical protein